MGWLDFLRQLFPVKENNCVELEEAVGDLQKEVDDKALQNIVQAGKIGFLEGELERVQKEFEGFKENVVLNGGKFYYSGKKKITHSWRAPNGKSVQIPVQDFIQPNLVELAEIARKNKLYLFDGANDVNYDLNVVKAYKLSLKLSYRLDEAQFNEIEKWLTAREALGTLEGDCEDSSHIIVSMLEHIGVPIDSIRCHPGLSNNNIGHHTVSVKDSIGVWRHLNSSNLFESFTRLTDYPVFGVNDKKFRTNAFNLKTVDYYYNSVIAESTLNGEALESFIVRNSSTTSDATQFNEFTEFQGRCVVNTGGVQEPVRNCKIEINGRTWSANNAGVFSIRIPGSLLGEQVASFSADGFKTRELKVVFEDGLTTSRLVIMYRGSNG